MQTAQNVIENGRSLALITVGYLSIVRGKICPEWARNRRIYRGSLSFRKYGSAVRYRLGDVKAAV